AGLACHSAGTYILKQAERLPSEEPAHSAEYTIQNIPLGFAMRIITGTLKGRKIDIPDTLNVRPTSDRTKEGMFSIIESRTYLKDARILDLFAGSGNLGF